MEFNTMVKDIIIEDNKVKGIITEKDEEYLAAEVISAVGREGADWFSHICGQHDIETNVGTVDIGVRVEVRDEVMEFLNQNLYEAKLVYHTPTFDDKVRTFCTNPSGEVGGKRSRIQVERFKDQQYQLCNFGFQKLYQTI